MNKNVKNLCMCMYNSHTCSISIDLLEFHHISSRFTLLEYYCWFNRRGREVEMRENKYEEEEE